ncbi:endonuclease III domain-containing protein [Gracilinema caldarium]|uniref:Endonuclease III n=1 Tax=Gracilinema caldarium (strain ATCC 51460 / DSM 7334 / H1) TaxID=744872 RepID=F8F0U8_GRAC1|nr:endonuclease III [Gracilinema caldarium]AEJ20234.1 DNA-(apurinic or apyrimidinic site) lyase [Gracilinema caldarium DSM 7334]
MPNSSVPWDTIFAILETWQQDLEKQGIDLPSVSNLAFEAETDTYRPWVVLVSTVISLRTKDAVTLSSSRRLLAKAPTPEALVKLTKDEIAQSIYPAGFYRTKAEHLHTIADLLIHQYDGKVPDTLEVLLSLPGVGRKTANLVLSEGFGQDAICVDTHVHRICNRTGWVVTKVPEETEQALRHILPRPYWRRINWLLVQFGQQICRPQSPLCSQCPLTSFCKRQGVSKSR